MAPPSLQEIMIMEACLPGNAAMECTGVLVTTWMQPEAVIDEAIAKGCNMVVAHHPIIFKGLKKDHREKLCGTNHHQGH